jgi:predicted nucleotide-binding protein
MTKQEAIEKLAALVERIPALEKQRHLSEDFTKWQHDTRALLKYAFPKEKEYIKEFDEISYSLPLFTTGTPDSAFEEAFCSGLRSARAMLQSRIDEVTQFWPDPPTKSDDAAKQTFPTPNLAGGILKLLTPNSAGPKNPDLVFVIHGRQLLGEFHIFLRALGLKPLEWSKARSLTGKPNPYTWEIVDKALSEAGAIVVLLTPDDEARLRSHLWSEHESTLEKEYSPQARQNVLFEAGVAYGRAPERTVLVQVGSHRPMSDLAGHHILHLDDSPQSRQAVADALQTAGCPVDVTGADWFRSGSFLLPEPSAKAGGLADHQIAKDAALLLLYKTQLKGFSDLDTAAEVVAGIHSFFASRPVLLNAASIAFLVKYPLDFKAQLFSNREGRKKWSLEDLKRDVELLRVEPDAKEG